MYIGATPSAHRGLVERALGAGKHVLLEKPLAATPADADAIVAAAEVAARRGVCLGMNIGMRYNDAIHEMRRLLRSGELGALRGGRLTLHFLRWPREWQLVPWCAGRAEGGPLREVGTHFVAALFELFGPRCVRSVSAEVSWPDGEGGEGAEGAVRGVVVLESGVSIELSVSTDGEAEGLAEDRYELELVCDGGGLVLDAFTTLRRRGSAPRARHRTVVSGGGYGRTECVVALVDAIGRAGSRADEECSEDEDRRVVSAGFGRDAQRVVDGLLSSRGEEVLLSYRAD